jgi:hypothetical protein
LAISLSAEINKRVQISDFISFQASQIKFVSLFIDIINFALVDNIEKRRQTVLKNCNKYPLKAACAAKRYSS